MLILQGRPEADREAEPRFTNENNPIHRAGLAEENEWEQLCQLCGHDDLQPAWASQVLLEASFDWLFPE